MKPALVCLLLAVASRSSEACGNPLLVARSKAVRALQQAEKLLESGKYKKALRVAAKVDLTSLEGAKVRSVLGDEAWERETNDDWAKELAGLVDRRTRVVAVARLRLGRVAAALPDLEALAKAAPDDPYLVARFAEALSLTIGSEERALGILTDLEERDLMPDSKAWAALARLRAQTGDIEGRDRALLFCKTSAKLKGDKECSTR